MCVWECVHVNGFCICIQCISHYLEIHTFVYVYKNSDFLFENFVGVSHNESFTSNTGSPPTST